jgi:hypothetical protein
MNNAYSIPVHQFPNVALYKSIDNNLALIECWLDRICYIPLCVNLIFGKVRVGLGLIQVTLATAMVAYYCFEILHQSYISDKKRDLKLAECQFIIENYAFHGIANIFRGMLESTLFISPICTIYNICGNARMRYHFEEPVQGATSHQLFFLNSAYF